MTGHSIVKRTAATLIAAAVTLQLCSCHERLIAEDGNVSELSFSWWGDDERNKRTLDGLNAFTEETGLTVRASYSGYDSMRSKMDTQIYSGAEADVMQLSYDWLYQYGRQGVEFYDLSKLSSIDLSTYPEESLGYGMIDGKLQAIPYGFDSLTFIYNKTLLDRYGLKTPSTWAELFSTAAVLRNDGVYALSLDDTFFWMVACAYLEQTAGRKAFDENGQLILTREDLTAMLNFSNRLIEEKVSPLGADHDRLDLSKEKMAGTVTWSSDPGYFEDTAKEMKVDLTLGTYLASDSYVYYGWYKKPTGLYAIKKDTKNPKEAGRLLNYLINSADMAVCLGMSKGVPVSSAAEEALEARGMLEGMEYEASRIMSANSKLEAMPPAMESSELIEIYTAALESIYYGSASIEEAADAAYLSMSGLS